MSCDCNRCDCLHSEGGEGLDCNFVDNLIKIEKILIRETGTCIYSETGEAVAEWPWMDEGESVSEFVYRTTGVLPQ